MNTTKWLALLLPILMAGCKLPTLSTYNVVKMAAPVRTEVDMTPERGPIVEIPLYGNCSSSQPHVAVIDIDGPLLNVQPSSLMGGEENPLSFFREKLDAVASRPNVTGLVLRINSAGGSVTASDVMYREVLNYKSRTNKPVIACLMDVGTGGAYYVSCAADAVVAHPTTVVGGCGVILNLYNLREAMATFNIIPQSIKSGSKIDMGASTSMLSPEASEMLQEMANEFHRRFIATVRKARPEISPDAEFFDGRVMTATQAYEVGLVDHVGYLDDAIKAVREASGVNHTGIVMYRRKDDRPRSPYSTSQTPPDLNGIIPLGMPGLSKRGLPLFLYMWLPDAASEPVNNY